MFFFANGNAIAEQGIACKAEYKSCMVKLLDKWEAYGKAYDNHPEECAANIHEWTKLDYKSVHCQDNYNNCKGNVTSVWERMDDIPEIALQSDSADEYGLSNLELQELRADAKKISNLRSFLISKTGKLLHESYYDLAGDSRPQRIRSVTKSIVSLLIGIAIDKGYIVSEDLLIKPFFKEYFANNSDERKENITIKHALTMTTGINFSDQNYYATNMEKGLQIIRDNNAYDWILDTDMLLSYKPGDVWLYNSMNVDLLTTILSSSTGMTTLQFAEKYLFAPLGIENYFWMHDSDENYYGGFTLALRPRALMRIGEMVLNEGMYGDERIVSKEWIKKSHYNQYPLGGEEGWEYGYLWWKYRVANKQVVSALGWGGQIMALVPSLDLTIVTTADGNVCSYKEQDEQFWEIMKLVENVIQKINN